LLDYAERYHAATEIVSLSVEVSSDIRVVPFTIRGTDPFAVSLFD
jgi:hypothetical protein